MTYLLQGNCDTRSSLLQYSYDGSNWSNISGACPSGSFSISIKIAGATTVYAREKGRFSYTSVATAKVRFLAPPSSNSMEFVAASRSDLETDRGIVSALGVSYSGEIFNSASHSLKTYIPGVVYDP
jgi:hypothetical protein